MRKKYSIHTNTHSNFIVTVAYATRFTSVVEQVVRVKGSHIIYIFVVYLSCTGAVLGGVQGVRTPRF